nr:HNH endonuclease [Microbulbifer guangxiensis]
MRAEGVCECCEKDAPFMTKTNDPYLEVHHLHRVSDGGPDSPEGVAAICPNCHRNIHNGVRGVDINEKLKKKIVSIESKILG